MFVDKIIAEDKRDTWGRRCKDLEGIMEGLRGETRDTSKKDTTKEIEKEVEDENRDCRTKISDPEKTLK